MPDQTEATPATLRPAPPLDTPARPVSGRLREAATVLTVACVVLALADSQGLLNWARDLTIPVAETVRLAVYAWHVLMDRFGLTGIHETLHHLFEQVHQL